MRLRVTRHEFLNQSLDDGRLRDTGFDSAVHGHLLPAFRGPTTGLGSEMRDDNVQALSGCGRALDDEGCREGLSGAIPGVVTWINEACDFKNQGRILWLSESPLTGSQGERRLPCKARKVSRNVERINKAIILPVDWSVTKL